jgi:hypothetical protein
MQRAAWSHFWCPSQLHWEERQPHKHNIGGRGGLFRDPSHSPQIPTDPQTRQHPALNKLQAGQVLARKEDVHRPVVGR